MSALNKLPSYKLGKNPKALAAQQADLQARLKKRPNDMFLKTSLKAVKSAMSKGPTVSNPVAAPGAPVSPATQPGATFDSVNQDANQALAGQFDQIEKQGIFNPGTFDEQQQRAQEAAMGSFNRFMEPQFAQQENAFRQRARAMGIDPESEAYRNRFANEVGNPQTLARQQALDSSFQQGLGAQNQAFGQAATQYQMPYQNLGAMAPFYAGQSQQGLQDDQQGFQKELAKLQQKYALQLQSKQKGGSAGLSLQDQMALQNNSFYNQMALYGLQGNQQAPLPNASSGFAQGISAGIGAGIGAGLK